MSQRKRRKLSPPEEKGQSVALPDRGVKAAPLPINDYLQSAAEWNLEQDYENRPRKVKGKKENSRLPIKTQDGRVEQVEQPQVADEESDSFLGSSSDDGDPPNGKAAEEAAVDQRPSREVILEAQEEMAKVAGLINQDPEEYINGLKTLGQLAESRNLTVRKLALITQLAVFKDVIPGYRIRPLTQESILEKVSKEVRRLRAFEQSLVSSYTAYVQTLASTVTSRPNASPDQVEVSQVALSCACQLVVAVPHFNCREELLKLLVTRLSRRTVNAAHAKCVSTLEQLFRDDEDGIASQEAVSMLTRMMKTRDYAVDESVLNTFLHLRLLNEFAAKASADAVDSQAKKPRQPREFRTKRQRKDLKELKAVEKEFQEADASVQREAKERAQAETLKLVFGAYFRILKTRSPRLMGAVLEGLARYAHLINQEFFGDLLVTLQELADEALAVLDTEVEDTADEPSSRPAFTPANLDRAAARRRALLCTTTAFALLSSQEAWSLKLDLSGFARTLYTLLIPLSSDPDLELTSRTRRLLDPDAPPAQANGTQSRTKVNATALSTLLLRACTSALTPRHTPPVRLAAFTHRLMLSALHTPEKTTVAILALLREVMQHQGRKIRPLWSTDEARGDGRFDPLAGIEAGRPFCGTVWEGELLRRHYAQGVKSGLGELESLVKDLA